MILVLSGASGSGKTSACGIAERLAAAAGRSVGGILCRAVFTDGRKTGIDARDLSEGPDAAVIPLARERRDAGRAADPRVDRGPPFDDADPLVLRYGMWEFLRPALSTVDEAAAAFISTSPTSASRSASTPALAIVDEIGPLELDRGVGMTRTLAGLDLAATAPGALDCLVVARPDIADRLTLRWPRAQRLEMAGMTYAEAAEAALARFGY